MCVCGILNEHIVKTVCGDGRNKDCVYLHSQDHIKVFLMMEKVLQMLVRRSTQCVSGSDLC